MANGGMPPIGGNFYRHLCRSNFNDVTITLKEERRAHLTLAHSLYPWQKPQASDKPPAELTEIKGGKGERFSYRMHWEDPYKVARDRLLAMEFESRRGMVRTVHSEEKDNIVPFPK